MAEMLDSCIGSSRWYRAPALAVTIWIRSWKNRQCSLPAVDKREDYAMYMAPIDDMQFLIEDVLGVNVVLGGLPQYAELGLGADLTKALLDEAAKFASD